MTAPTAGPDIDATDATHTHATDGDHAPTQDGAITPWAVLQDYQCFGCSPHNPQGLQLRFRPHDGGLSTSFQLGSAHESYPGVVHGGLIGVICDETMGNLIVLRLGKPAFTTGMRLRYLAPVTVGGAYECRARILTESTASGLVEADSEILDGEGNRVATARATYRPTDLDLARDRITLSADDAGRLARALDTTAREES